VRDLVTLLAGLLVIGVSTFVLAACGGGGNSGDQMVWCFAPGETVTAEKKQEYPELYMSKQACDAVNEVAR
jgi:hypothetical protein